MSPLCRQAVVPSEKTVQMPAPQHVLYGHLKWHMEVPRG